MAWARALPGREAAERNEALRLHHDHDRRPSSDGPVSAPRTQNPGVHNFHAQKARSAAVLASEFASLNAGWPTNMTLRKSVVMIRSAESN
jgi:hypothetical protein